MVLDVLKPLGHKKILENELEGYGIRLNCKPPQITFRKKEKGGLSISSTVRRRPAPGALRPAGRYIVRTDRLQIATGAMRPAGRGG